MSMEIDMKTIGNRIKLRRLELGLKQVDIKESVGISSGNLSEVENGNRAPSMITLYRLSQILNCSIDWIVTGKSPSEENLKNSFIGDREIELLKLFHGMSKDNQDELLMIAEIKYQKDFKGNTLTVKSSNSSDNIEIA